MAAAEVAGDAEDSAAVAVEEVSSMGEALVTVFVARVFTGGSTAAL
jgi:hypothetical protein